jgi:hypothetical protein
MTTKEEYEKAIENIREAFYATTCPEWALEKFATNLDFISISIKEHFEEKDEQFEEKTETNYEHYKDEIKLLKFVKGTPMLLSETAEQLFKERGFTKSNECTNPSYFKKDDPYAWINFSDTGVAISSQHELGYEHLDYELIKAIYTQMKELEVIE